MQRLKNRIDAVRMLTDVSVEFHRQKPGLKCIAGVEARFQLFAGGVSVSHGVGSTSLMDGGHDAGTLTFTS